MSVAEDPYRDLNETLTAHTLRQRLRLVVFVLGLLVLAGVATRLVETGLNVTGVGQRLERIANAFDAGVAYPIVIPFLFVIVMFLGIILGLVPGLLAGQRIRYQPAEDSGLLRVGSLEEATSLIKKRCHSLGFAWYETPGEAGRSTSISARAQGESHVGGHEEAPRVVSVQLTVEPGGVRAQVACRFDTLILMDTGETDYCRDVVNILLGKQEPEELSPGPAFLAYSAFAHGVLACIPILLGQLSLGDFRAYGWMVVGISGFLGVSTGLIALGTITARGGRTYGRSAALAAVLMGLAGPVGTLLSERIVFVG